jgi:hypothetical protein
MFMFCSYAAGFACARVSEAATGAAAFLPSGAPSDNLGVCFRHPNSWEEDLVLKKLLIALLATGFFAAVTLPNYTIAQTTTTEDTKKKATKKKAKKDDATADTKAEPKKKKAPSAKQLAARKKFSDCAKSWGDHKKASGEKGQKAYRAYMSKCLKKDG